MFVDLWESGDKVEEKCGLSSMKLKFFVWRVFWKGKLTKLWIFDSFSDVFQILRDTKVEIISPAPLETELLLFFLWIKQQNVRPLSFFSFT